MFTLLEFGIFWSHHHVSISTLLTKKSGFSDITFLHKETSLISPFHSLLLLSLSYWHFIQIILYFFLSITIHTKFYHICYYQFLLLIWFNKIEVHKFFQYTSFIVHYGLQIFHRVSSSLHWHPTYVETSMRWFAIPLIFHGFSLIPHENEAVTTSAIYIQWVRIFWS